MVNEEQYDAWESDNEETLREDFLMRFTQKELREYILEDYNRTTELVEMYTDEWNTYCSEMYSQEMDAREVEK